MCIFAGNIIFISFVYYEMIEHNKTWTPNEWETDQEEDWDEWDGQTREYRNGKMFNVYRQKESKTDWIGLKEISNSSVFGFLLT